MEYMSQGHRYASFQGINTGRSIMQNKETSPYFFEVQLVPPEAGKPLKEETRKESWKKAERAASSQQVPDKKYTDQAP